MKLSDIATSMQLKDEDYLPIWTALMETSRGRRFLSEFARRTRAAETRTLLDLITKLENALVVARTAADAAAAPNPAPSPAPAAHNDSRLAEAVAGALPELAYAGRINAGALNDLALAAEAMNNALVSVRQLTLRLHPRESEPARRACDTLDAQIGDISEIVAAQRIALSHADAAFSRLSEAAGHDAAQGQDQATPEAAYTGAEPASPPLTATQGNGIANGNGPAVQQLIQEIAARLLHKQQNAAS